MEDQKVYQVVTQTVKIIKKTPGLNFIHSTYCICRAGFLKHL